MTQSEIIYQPPTLHLTDAVIFSRWCVELVVFQFVMLFALLLYSWELVSFCVGVIFIRLTNGDVMFERDVLCSIVERLFALLMLKILFNRILWLTLSKAFDKKNFSRKLTLSETKSVSARNLECCFCKACWLGYNRLILKNNQKVLRKSRGLVSLNIL